MLMGDIVDEYAVDMYSAACHTANMSRVCQAHWQIESGVQLNTCSGIPGHDLSCMGSLIAVHLHVEGEQGLVVRGKESAGGQEGRAVDGGQQSKP